MAFKNKVRGGSLDWKEATGKANARKGLAGHRVVWDVLWVSRDQINFINEEEINWKGDKCVNQRCQCNAMLR